MATLIYKIPPTLPFSKGRKNSPLWQRGASLPAGQAGGDFHNDVCSIMRPLINRSLTSAVQTARLMIISQPLNLGLLIAERT